MINKIRRILGQTYMTGDLIVIKIYFKKLLLLLKETLKTIFKYLL